MINMNIFSWSFNRLLSNYWITKPMFFFKLLKLMNYLFFIVIFFIGIFIFVYRKKHLLVILLSLEYIVLRLFILIYLYLRLLDFQYFLLIIYLIISVCEGVLGLAILVTIVRIYGNDYFQRFNII